MEVSSILIADILNTSTFPFIPSAKRSNLFRIEFIFNCARITLFIFFLRTELKLYLNFSLLLPFSKAQSAWSSVSLFLISVRSLSRESQLCLWGYQTEYIFFIEFINTSLNFAERFKFKCNLLLFRCLFGLMTLALSIKCIFTFENTSFVNRKLPLLLCRSTYRFLVLC